MESGHKSGGGASGGAGGGACNVCGYQYPNPNPSAKHRRAHRKNCGKTPSAATATAAAAEEGSGERDGKKLLLVEDKGEGGGDGSGTIAADCGGGFPGSAQEVGNAVEKEDSAEHSSPDGAGVQVTSNNTPSEDTPKANGTDNDEIESEVVMQLSESAPHHEDCHPSQPTLSCDQHLDASASHHLSEPEDGAKFSSEFSADEINKSTVMSLASNAVAGEISAQTNVIVGCPDDIAVTEVDCMLNTIGKDTTSEDILVKGSEIDPSCEEMQTKLVDGHSATTVEKDPSISNFSVASNEETPGQETEFKNQSGLILTSSIEQVSTIKDPVNLIGDKQSYTEKHVCTDNTNGADLFKLATGGCHMETLDVKPQQHTDSTSAAADQLTIAKQTDNEEGKHCPDPDEVTQAVSSATGPAVGAEVTSASTAANLTDKTMGDIIQDNVMDLDNTSNTSGITFMPSQVDLVGSYPTSHEIYMVSSKDGVEENRQSENISADLTAHEINEVHNIDVEEKQHNEDIRAYATSHETNAVCSTGIFGENRQNEEVSTETSSHKVSIVRSESTVEEKEQIEGGTANPASDKIDVISSADIAEEKKQNEEITTDPTCEINVVNVPSNVELEKNNDETTRDPTAHEVNMVNITDNVDKKMQNEETTADPTPDDIKVICSHDSEGKKHNEDMSEGPSSHDIIEVNATDNVKEKNDETISYKIDAVNTTSSVEEKKQNEEITAGPTGGITAVHTTDNLEEKKGGEPTSDPTPGKINAESNTDDAEVKKQNEQIAGGEEISIPQAMDNAEEKKQNEEVAADPTSNKFPAAQSTDDAEEKPKEETSAKEIGTTQSADDLKGNDQNEEIADKEMLVNSDKNHVSLKALLAEKGVETKEKKASTKDRVLSFRRRASKDNTSPTKAGSPRTDSVQQDWNSPARLPVEKTPKGKKQQWMPFICCPSIK